MIRARRGRAFRVFMGSQVLQVEEEMVDRRCHPRPETVLNPAVGCRSFADAIRTIQNPYRKIGRPNDQSFLTFAIKISTKGALLRSGFAPQPDEGSEPHKGGL